jgi:hypothetical protein
MKHRSSRLVLPIFAFAAALTGAMAFAQQPPAPQHTVPPEQVLTGCLRSSAADTAVAGPSGRIFTLEVMERPRPATDAAGASAPAQPTKTTYSLAAAEALGLAAHADHQVELTGRMQAPAAAAPRPGEPAREPASQPAAGGGHRTFEVSTLKMVSAKCP